MNYQLYPLGDCAVVMEFGKVIDLPTHHIVQVISTFLEDQQNEWMIEYVPAFTSIAIYYDPIKVTLLYGNEKAPYEIVCNRLNDMLSWIPSEKLKQSSLIEIPVCYGGEFGPDLETVAKVNRLTPEEVIEIHTRNEYLVYMIGFAPGFPYLGGMDQKIAAPRKETPRLQIPARSVGIAGNQTGIYPIETPGGWQIIGRTPIDLFKPNEDPPSLLKAGDRIRFASIYKQEYIRLEAENTHDPNH